MPFYIILFFLLILAFFDKAIASRFVFVERDLAGFFIPPKYLWVSLVKSLQLPLWNPYNYSGIPLIATLQPGVFYPPHIFYLFLPFHVVWNWLIILHFVLAGTTIFLFLRYLKTSNTGAFIGGIVFMLSGYLLSVHNLLPHLFSVSWFPLIIMFFIKAMDEKKTRYIAYTSICLSMQFLAGAPEIVMMTVSVLFLFALFIFLFQHGQSQRIHMRVLCFMVVICVFFLISSVQLIPFYELSRYSIRKGGLPYHEAITWSFAWKDFVQFFLPNPYGYLQSDAKYWANQSWLKTVYLGICPFILSIFYFASRDRRRLVFFALMVLSFIFALGGNTPIYKVLYHIPPFNSVRYPVKFLFLFFFVMAMTSGLGYDKLKQGIKDMDEKTGKIIQLIFYTGFVFAVGWGIVNIFNDGIKKLFELYNIKPDGFNDIDFNIHNIKRFFLFSFFFCVMLLVCLRIRYKKTALFFLIAILTADLFFANYGYYKLAQWNEYMEKNPFEEKIKNNEFKRYIVTPKTKDIFSLYPEDKKIMAPAYSALSGLYTESGMEVMRIAHYELFTNILYGTKSIEEAKRFFDVAGIGYVISLNEIKDRDFELLDSMTVEKTNLKNVDDDTKDVFVRLYRYKDVPERFLLFEKAIFVHDTQTAVEKMQDRGIDLRSNLIIIHDNKKHKDLYESKGNEGIDKVKKARLEILSYTPNKIEITCETEKDMFLYISDTFYPGWKAYVDGKNTELYRANIAFRAVEVPKGRHTIVFKYVPFSFYMGIALSILGIAFLVYLIKRS